MPPVTTMPTNMPKTNTNFSIDWLVKSDNKTSTRASNTSQSDRIRDVQREDSLEKEYNLEVSKALRLPPLSIPTPPSDSESSIVSAKESPSPNDYYYQYSMNNHAKLDAAIDSSRSPTIPAIPSPPFDPKFSFNFNYDKQSINLPPHLAQPHPALQQHQQHQQQHQQHQQHSQILSAQLQMAAAINYQRQHAAMAAAAAAASSSGHHSQAFNFPQILSNNFQRTPYQMQPWMTSRYPRLPYVLPRGKFKFSFFLFCSSLIILLFELETTRQKSQFFSLFLCRILDESIHKTKARSYSIRSYPVT